MPLLPTLSVCRYFHHLNHCSGAYPILSRHEPLNHKQFQYSFLRLCKVPIHLNCNSNKQGCRSWSSRIWVFFVGWIRFRFFYGRIRARVFSGRPNKVFDVEVLIWVLVIHSNRIPNPSYNQYYDIKRWIFSTFFYREGRPVLTHFI